jgi:hypothetical protein
VFTVVPFHPNEVVTMTKQLEHPALADFTRRWFALWTEADPQARSKQIAGLWATNGAQVLVDPPQAMRDASTELAFPVPRLEVRAEPDGHMWQVSRADGVLTR